MMPPLILDLFEMPEDDRITAIGKAATAGYMVGFIVENAAKADRYIDKILKRFKVRIVDRTAGPISNSVLVRVGPLEHFL